MPRVNNAAGALKVAGVYARLLEVEREKCQKPDPRVVVPGTLELAVFRRPRRLLQALEAGEPVELPVWMLGGWTVPDERIRRLKRGDRSISAWVVHADDSVTPVRGAASAPATTSR